MVLIIILLLLAVGIGIAYKFIWKPTEKPTPPGPPDPPKPPIGPSECAPIATNFFIPTLSPDSRVDFVCDLMFKMDHDDVQESIELFEKFIYGDLCELEIVDGQFGFKIRGDVDLEVLRVVYETYIARVPTKYMWSFDDLLELMTKYIMITTYDEFKSLPKGDSFMKWNNFRIALYIMNQHRSISDIADKNFQPIIKHLLGNPYDNTPYFAAYYIHDLLGINPSILMANVTMEDYTTLTYFTDVSQANMYAETLMSVSPEFVTYNEEQISSADEQPDNKLLPTILKLYNSLVRISWIYKPLTSKDNTCLYNQMKNIMMYIEYTKLSEIDPGQIQLEEGVGYYITMPTSSGIMANYSLKKYTRILKTCNIIVPTREI